MTKVWQLTALLVFAATAGAAQRPAHTPTPHVKSAAPSSKQPATETRGAESAEHVKSFRGIAERLNMTPEALQTAYEQARSTNPKLTRGQFIAANMLGHNLSDKGITTDKILAGLASGKSIGQTLHSLGLSDQDAKAAEKAADRDVRAADKEADKAAKAQEKKQDTKQ
ncbi:MAG: hypothetical protein AUH81_06560 [Candidatus Rokubacteria bacterium 13_1_40CM_4_69_5]|nr:MAG: hypothetical protein AUH81_06560 [Candidatus Rokubacteria bacterium 13_1_40CM_4_69_5]